MNLRDKRGIELMGKTIIEVLVAIAVVVLLLYAGYVLFQTYFGNQQEEQAKGQLEEITDLIAEMELGQEEEIPILAPTGWNLVAFHKNQNFVDEFEKPFIMQGQDCLCICKGKKCEICRAVNKPFRMNSESFSVKIPQQANITKYGEYYDFKVR
jgi:type II secretory pathway pseudopilin PulG